MAKYAIEIDFPEDDCSFCPLFWQSDLYDGACQYDLADRSGEMHGYPVKPKDGSGTVVCFDRPEWCPLVSVDDQEGDEGIFSMMDAVESYVMKSLGEGSSGYRALRDALQDAKWDLEAADEARD